MSYLIPFVCLTACLLILIQRPNESGLAHAFQALNKVRGIRKTAATLEKGTWSIVSALFVLCSLAAAI